MTSISNNKVVELSNLQIVFTIISVLECDMINLSLIDCCNIDEEDKQWHELLCTLLF